MDRFLIQSDNTKYFLTTNDEVPDHVVVTADGKDTIPQHALVTIRPPPGRGGPPVIATITGPNGLFVALPEDAGGDAKLIWSRERYQWVVTRTAQSENDTGPYEIRPATGQDLYWFDRFGIGPVIIVKPGREVQAPQAYFTILPLHR